MAVKGSKATVSTAGVKLFDATGSDRETGASALCVMEGTGPVYIGGTQAEAVANAAATQGRWDKTILAAISLAAQAGEEVWAATASSTCVVQVIKSGA